MKIRELLLEMRKYRIGLIQTPDQLRFSYAAIIEGAKQLPLDHVVTFVKLNFLKFLLWDFRECEVMRVLMKTHCQGELINSFCWHDINGICIIYFFEFIRLNSIALLKAYYKFQKTNSLRFYIAEH